MARPITAFRSPCMTLCASSSPNRPARPARTQKPPRASRDMIAARAPIHGLPFAYGIPYVLPPPQGRPAKSALIQNASRTSFPLNVRRIVMAGRAPRGALSSPYCASSRVIERHTAAPAFPLLPVFFPPKLSGQITPTRQPQHFVPPHDFLTKRKNRRAIPAFLRDCAAVRHIDYAFASVSMAWANILTLSMNFSQSTYSSGIWQVSTSPGKLMPKATVLGIMRE